MSTLATKRGNPVTSVAIVRISDPESIRVKFPPRKPTQIPKRPHIDGLQADTWLARRWRLYWELSVCELRPPSCVC